MDVGYCCSDLEAAWKRGSCRATGGCGAISDKSLQG